MPIFTCLAYHVLCPNLCHAMCTFCLVDQGCENEVAEAANEEQKNESLMRLSWALVHSRQPEDVNRGIGMLQGNEATYIL
jgi:hypothetical protein